MPARRMRQFLDENEVRYVTLNHSPAYTAQAVASSAHIPSGQMAKVVMIRVDGKPAMAVLPASFQVDFDELRDGLGASEVVLMSENEFKNQFPDCETGAMPPFGNLYGMPVYVAESLAEDECIAFNAGTHREVVLMRYSDFERLVQPKATKFSTEILML